MRAAWKGAAGGLLVFLAAATGGTAQDLVARVEAVRDGWVTFDFAVEDDVEVCDRGIRTLGPDGETRSHWHWGRGGEGTCGPGPLQVELEVSEGRVEGIRARRVRVLDGAVRVGEVPSQEASDFLVSLAYRDAEDDVAQEGFALSRFPRGADPSRGILRAARDRTLAGKVRKSAIFWAGQLAADQVVAPLAQMAREDDEEQSVRDAAVFALSQHEGAGAVPALMDLALEAPHAGTRRTALFWLAQNDDERVVEFLADIILGRRGG